MFTKANMMVVAALALVLVTGVTGCARNSVETGYNNAAISDPIEPVNRAVFAFNDVLDRFVLEPVATAYETVVPDFLRNSIRNFIRNVGAPMVVANNLLQGNLSGAGNAASRFAINTTAGVFGLVDVAAEQGLPWVPEDFGQTLAVWGFGEGFYLVLPIFGPSNPRDGVGLAADILADPVRLYAQNTDNDYIFYIYGAVDVVDNRARMLKATRDLRKNSLDYYAAIRSAYTQRRRSLIKNESSSPASAAPAIPDYEDKR